MTAVTYVPESSPILAWHFLSDSQKLRDGRTAPPDGEVLAHDGPVVPCKSGLHASEDIFDALLYSPGHILCRVECWGTTRKEHDKLACDRRRILWRINTGPLLRQWARWCALQFAHLWNPPKVVMDFLTTGDESLRGAAWDAAWDETLPLDEAVAAAAAAARAAAWAETRETRALDVARTTAQCAAQAAASDGSRRDAATVAQRTKLLELIEAARKEVYANRT